MVITVATALEMLPEALSLAAKLATIIKTNSAMSVEEEITALEAARMKSSDEIIAGAGTGANAT